LELHDAGAAQLRCFSLISLHAIELANKHLRFVALTSLEDQAPTVKLVATPVRVCPEPVAPLLNMLAISSLERARSKSAGNWQIASAQ
jgi:hypothetical protein